MKKITYILIYSIIILIISAFTTPLISRVTPSITVASTNYLDSFIFILTLIVAIITILFAIFGVFEFAKVEKIQKQLDSFDNRMEDIKRVMAIHNQTMYQFNEFLYTAILKIAESTESQDLLEDVTLHYHITSLYCSNFDSEDSNLYNNTEDDFNYIQQNGTTDIIRFLEYMAEHDTDKKNRDRARKIIGHIEEREKESSDNIDSAGSQEESKTSKNWFCSLFNAFCAIFK